MIGITIGGDPAWLAAIGIGGIGFTTWAAWFATHSHLAPAGEPAGEAAADTEPAPIEGQAAAGLAEPVPERHADSYQVLDAVPLAVLVVDRRRDILWANDRMRQLLGEAVAGHSLMGVLRHPPLIDALDQVMGQGSAPGGAQGNAHGTPGDTQGATPAGAPAGGQGGETASVPSAIGGIETPIGRDRLLIADLKRLDAERVLIALRDVSAEHRLERLRSDFIANVSHELKTPIATLMGFIETLRGPAKGDFAAHERFLGIMHEQASRMSRLVADLLSLSRIELNEHARPSGGVDLTEVIGRVARSCSSATR